jgi:hypothetical protein
MNDSSNVTDTEFVHFEVIAERPRRKGARRGLLLLAVVLAIVAVLALRARQRAGDDDEPGEPGVLSPV